MKTKLLCILVAGVSLLLCSGCASTFAHGTGSRTSGAYPGVKESVLSMNDKATCGVPVPRSLLVLILLLDLPLTTVLDTLLLPSDLGGKPAPATPSTTSPSPAQPPRK